jgi:hypothetical protein
MLANEQMKSRPLANASIAMHEPEKMTRIPSSPAANQAKKELLSITDLPN